MKQRSKKEKVTLSLSHDIVVALDRVVKESHISRSGIVENVLENWYEQELREQLSREAAEYYQSLSTKERQEESAIAKFSTKAAHQVWEDE